MIRSPRDNAFVCASTIVCTHSMSQVVSLSTVLLQTVLVVIFFRLLVLQQFMVLIDLEFYVFVVDHLPFVVVSYNKFLLAHILGRVFFQH